MATLAQLWKSFFDEGEPAGIRPQEYCAPTPRESRSQAFQIITLGPIPVVVEKEQQLVEPARLVESTSASSTSGRQQSADSPKEAEVASRNRLWSSQAGARREGAGGDCDTVTTDSPRAEDQRWQVSKGLPQAQEPTQQVKELQQERQQDQSTSIRFSCSNLPVDTSAEVGDSEGAGLTNQRTS